MVQSSGSDNLSVAYEPRWDSIDARPIPSWFDDSKFGVFLHWGLYSVPCWAPRRSSVQLSGEAYSEWYGWAMRDRKSRYWEFHRKVYGESFTYDQFATAFRAEMFDPDEWAGLFRDSGARYVTLTSKHHDGFCLWPSAESGGRNSVELGPHRDLVDELANATRRHGLRFGVYYSLMEWDHPLYISDPRSYARQHMIPQMKDLVARYEPSLLYTDGEWQHPSDVWGSCEFLTWLFNESPVKDEIVVNDRWGSETRSTHGGYFTSEYGLVDDKGKTVDSRRKWEETRGIGSSFGYNRNERLSDYLGEAELIQLLVTTVGRGGNLHLNVGPTADGRIPVIMQERLLQIGEWLRVNGEAIYGTHALPAKHEDSGVYMTAKGRSIYAHCLQWPGRTLTLELPSAESAVTSVHLLGLEMELKYAQTGRFLTIEIPALSVHEMPCRHAYVFKVVI
jgi:alpha-L-fucosidase